MEMYLSQAEKFEAFRPQLEGMIRGGTLVDYMRERLQVVTSDFSNWPALLTSTTPILHSDYKVGEYEDPKEIFRYFSGRSGHKEGIYLEEIDGAARTLLRELKEDAELAKSGEYVNRLAFYLVFDAASESKGVDHESNEITLDLLLTNGGPIVSEPYFDDIGERAILYLFEVSYDSKKFPEEKKKATLELLSSYIKQDYGGLALKAGLTLLIVNYKECIKMLPQVMDKVEDTHHFTLAWYLAQKIEPDVLAEDLWTQLDEEHIQYFIQALRSSSGDFKDEKSNEFLKEITKRITQ